MRLPSSDPWLASLYGAGPDKEDAMAFGTAPAARSRRTHGAAIGVRGHAASLTWRLRELLGDADAWVTTRAWLQGEAGLMRPDLCVASGELPVDGVLAGADLAIMWSPESVPVRALLGAGAAEVWSVLTDRVVVHRGRHPAEPRRRDGRRPTAHMWKVGIAGAGQELRVPGSGGTVLVDDLLLPRGSTTAHPAATAAPAFSA